MNIDKARMEHVYNNRHIPKHNNELMENFMEIARYHANRLNINREIYDDYVQEVVMTAIRSLEKYDSKKNSNPFSYFYKVIYMRLLWLLRRDHNKDLRKPTTYSLDIVDSSTDEQSSDLDHLFDEKIADIQDVENRIVSSTNDDETHRLEKQLKKMRKNMKNDSIVEIGGMVVTKSDLIDIVRKAKKKYEGLDSTDTRSFEDMIKEAYQENKESENV